MWLVCDLDLGLAIFRPELCLPVPLGLGLSEKGHSPTYTSVLWKSHECHGNLCVMVALCLTCVMHWDAQVPTAWLCTEL